MGALVSDFRFRYTGRVEIARATACLPIARQPHRFVRGMRDGAVPFTLKGPRCSHSALFTTSSFPIDREQCGQSSFQSRLRISPGVASSLTQIMQFVINQIIIISLSSGRRLGLHAIFTKG